MSLFHPPPNSLSIWHRRSILLSKVPATGALIPATGALIPATGALIPATGAPSMKAPVAGTLDDLPHLQSRLELNGFFCNALKALFDGALRV